MMLCYVLSGPFTTLWLRKTRQVEAALSNGVDISSQEPV
jgi:hypothetical protein